MACHSTKEAGCQNRVPTGVKELISLTRALITVVVSFLYSLNSALTSWTSPLVAGRSLPSLPTAPMVTLL